MAASEDWAAKVTDDMQGIFVSAGLTGDRIDDARPSLDVSRPVMRGGRSTARRSFRWVTLCAPVMALAAAGFLFTQIHTASPVKAASVQRSAPRQIDHVAAFTAIAPLASSRETAVPVDGTVADVISPPVADGGRIATPRIIRVAANDPNDRRGQTVARMPARTTSISQTDGCRAGSTENACIYRDVRAADRRLLVAYQRAVQAGVPRRDLVEVRRDWTRALAISLDDLDETIRRYDDLADQLRYLANAESAARFVISE